MTKTKKRKRVMHSLTIKEIAGVDVPAMEGARHVISKRAPKDREEIEKGGDARLTSDVEGHAHLLDAAEQAGRTSHDMSEGEEFSHSHPWIRRADGTIVIGMSDGHTHEVLEKRAALDNNRSNDMTDVDKKAAEDAVKKLADAEARAERAEKLAEFTDAQKTHFAKMSDSQKESFLALDSAGRQREVEKATAADPVVYTSPRTGKEYRKSGNTDVLDAVRSADEAWEVAKTERELRQDGDLQKRADALGSIPGEADVKKALLKAIDSIEDETLRKGALEIVVSANSGLSKSFDRRGTEGGPARGTNGDAEARYEKMAQDFAKANDCTIEKARAEVLLTDEGAEVYHEMTSPVAID